MEKDVREVLLSIPIIAHKFSWGDQIVLDSDWR